MPRERRSKYANDAKDTVGIASQVESLSSSLAQSMTEIKDVVTSIDETKDVNTQLGTITIPSTVKIKQSHTISTALTNVKDKVLTGKGEIVKKSVGNKVENFFVDVKPTYNTFKGKVNKLNSHSVLKAFSTKAKLGTAKVGIIGDSISTTGGTNYSMSHDNFTVNGATWSYAPNGLTETDSYFYRTMEALTKAFRTTTFDFYNYAIAGTNLSQYNSQQTFSSVTKTWIDFIKDQDVDMIFINWGMNHSNYILARETQYYLNMLLDYIATWTNPPVVIVSTCPQPVMQMDNSTYGSGDAQFSRFIASHALRQIAQKRGCYVLDINYLYNCLKNGIDFERMYMVSDIPIFSGTAVDNLNGSYTLANGQSLYINNGNKDYVLEFDLDVPDYSLCASGDMLDVYLNNALDGASNFIANSRFFVFPNTTSLFKIINYGNFADPTHYPNPTQTNTTGRTNKMSIRVEKRGSELNIYKNRQKIIRDRLTCVDVAGFIQLKSSIATTTCTISNIKLYKAKYLQYMPLLTDTEAWGTYNSADTSTKPTIGGNGVNHPSTMLLEYVYNECLREFVDDLKIASI
jgi:hypothetical protein